jgi:hypothetical protein
LRHCRDTAKEIADKTEFSEDEVRKELETLFFNGVVFPRGDFVNREYYRFARSVGQLHDATQATKHRDVGKEQEFYK